ncbi:MAG TPA: UbiA family prenyltransferase [Pseudonocardiaceae bacterium]|nr:UbiA family prenyltransferase [Pseudonocardiaceae bacterium]
MTRSGTLVGLVRACHPDACVTVTAIAVLLGVAVGRGAGGLVLVGTAVLAGQLCIGWTNDYLDAVRDADTGRTDKPVASGSVPRRTVLVTAIAAGVACVPLSLAVGLLPGVLHLIAVLSALAYDAWLKATVASVLPYLVSFGLLPLFVVLGLPGAHPPWWLPVAGALLGGGAHFTNVLPDLADDKASGVVGLPHRLGATGSRWAAVVLLLGASGVLALGPTGHALPRALLAAASVPVLAAGLVLGRRPGSRLAFQAVLVVALLAVCQLVLAGASLR